MCAILPKFVKGDKERMDQSMISKKDRELLINKISFYI